LRWCAPGIFSGLCGAHVWRSAGARPIAGLCPVRPAAGRQINGAHLNFLQRLINTGLQRFSPVSVRKRKPSRFNGLTRSQRGGGGETVETVSILLAFLPPG